MALPSYLIKQEQRSPSFRRSFLFRFAPSSSYLVWRFYEYMIQQLLEYRLEDWKWMQKFCEWAPEKWMNRAGGSGCDACRTAGATAQARIFFPFSGLAIPSGLGGGDGQPFYSSNFACFAFLQRSIISVILNLVRHSVLVWWRHLCTHARVRALDVATHCGRGLAAVQKHRASSAGMVTTDHTCCDDQIL